MTRMGMIARALVLTVLALALPAAGQLQPFTPGLGTPLGVEPRFAEAYRRTSLAAAAPGEPVAAGQTFDLAVTLRVDRGYYAYGPVPGGTYAQPPGLAIAVEAAGLEPGEALFPPTIVHVSQVGDLRDEHRVYEGATTFHVPVHVPAGAEPGRRTLEVTVTGQICSAQVCLDLRQRATATVTVAPPAAGAAPVAYQPPAGDYRTAGQWREALESTGSGFAPVVGAGGPDLSVLAAFALALLAGLTLNIMPCVLPVIPLKVLNIVQQAGESRRRAVGLGLAFAGGILAFFLALAVFSLVLRLATGHVLQWSEPFQIPAVKIGLSLLIVAMALNLLGVFTVSISGQFAGGQRREGPAGAVFMGLLAGIMSLPCSFGLLGTAVAWAQTRPPWAGVMVFVLIGLGMAVPYLLLTAFPRLLQWLPKPGLWMERFKQSMGFILLTVAVWLVSTLGDPSWIWRVGVFAVVLSVAVWVGFSWVTLATPAGKRWGVRLAALAVTVAAGLVLLPEPRPSPVPWRTFTSAAVEEARQAGRIAVVEFTSDTCVNCKWVEATVYDRASTVEALARYGAVPFKANVDHNPEAHATLYEQLRSATPLTLVLPPGGREPIPLVGVFSQDRLIEALEQAQ